eukprot:XP_011448399.1 PREDICTED: perlucin-like protein [Crassostrea gigas]
MWNSLVLAVVFGVCIQEALSHCCPVGWEQHGVSCYLFSKNKLNWKDSLNSCASVGGWLVAIESSSENVFIKSRLYHEFASPYFWIGATDQFRSHRKWYWVRTEHTIESGYSDWYRTEPDNPGRQHCLAMRKDFHYQWSNDYCNELFGYICERLCFSFTSAHL